VSPQTPEFREEQYECEIRREKERERKEKLY